MQERVMDLAGFLAWEARQVGDERYEFLDGEIVGFGQGATQEHNELVARLFEFVRSTMPARCRAFVGMQRVVVGRDATYPDVVLTCDERDHQAEDRTQLRYPALAIEVLSPSTASVDLIRKRRIYGRIPSLVEYLTVDSRERFVAVFRRDGDKLVEDAQRSAGRIAIASLGAELDVDALYAGVVEAEVVD